jgi:aspartate racemase
LAKPQHIGIVACSAEGAALCYRTICAQGANLLGAHAHPEVTLHSHPLVDYVQRIEADDWHGVADLMLVSAEKLAGAGAGFLICPDNTIHRAMPLVEERSPLPWLHIAEVVAEEAAAQRFARVALTGTRWLVQSEIYPEKLAVHGIECVRPEAVEREEINRIIMDELVYGVVKPEAAAYFTRVVLRMKQAGCDALVLGCTELPMLAGEEDCPLPRLDSTRLLASAALRRAVACSR